VEPGLTSRDSTFEAIDALLTKRLPGFGELFRMLSYEDIGSAAMMSQRCAGTIGTAVVIALPGSEKAVRLAMTKLVLARIDAPGAASDKVTCHMKTEMKPIRETIPLEEARQLIAEALQADRTH
jgi:molybdopterin biosynthesis enzyme MoaB